MFYGDGKRAKRENKKVIFLLMRLLTPIVLHNE